MNGANLLEYAMPCEWHFPGFDWSDPVFNASFDWTSIWEEYLYLTENYTMRQIMEMKFLHNLLFN